MEKIDEFIKVNKTRLQTLLDKFQWTAEGVWNESTTSTQIKQYESSSSDSEDPCFPTSVANNNSIVLEKCELQRLLNNPEAKVPQKFSDLELNFSREEKLLLYEYVKGQQENVDSVSMQKDIISLADIVALKKLEKKKRRKHRTSKPSYMEELHSLLEMQMQALEQYFGEKFGPKLESKLKDVQRNEASCSRYDDKETRPTNRKNFVQKAEFRSNFQKDNLMRRDVSHLKISNEDPIRKLGSHKYHQRSSSKIRDNKRGDRRRRSRSLSRKHKRYHRPSRSRSRSPKNHRRRSKSLSHSPMSHHRRSRSRSPKNHRRRSKSLSRSPKSHHTRSRSRSPKNRHRRIKSRSPKNHRRRSRSRSRSPKNRHRRTKSRSQSRNTSRSKKDHKTHRNR